MAVTTEQDIDRLLKEKLREDGVLDQLESTSLFFSPEGVLVEVVLKDASAVDRAEQAIRQVGQELEGEGMYLLPTVRAVWEVESVERVSLPPGTCAGRGAGHTFPCHAAFRLRSPRGLGKRASGGF